MFSLYRRIRGREKCPICGHAGWCLVRHDGTAAICARVESDQRVGEACGWRHRLGGPGPARFPGPRKYRTPPVPPSVDFAALHDRCVARLPSNDLLHERLGLGSESLRRLGLGWHEEQACWTFPMRDECGEIIGLRTRHNDGSKRAIAGSRNGLFLPESDREPAEIWIVEGPTDCAAMLDMGFDVIGRPGNNCGTSLLVRLVKRLQPAAVMLMLDHDPVSSDAERLTWDAAEALARALPCRTKIMCPPYHKDIRDWYRSGATSASVRALAEDRLWHSQKGIRNGSGNGAKSSYGMPGIAANGASTRPAKRTTS